MKRAITLLSLVLLCGCAKGAGISLMPYEDQAYTPQSFKVCHGFGCSYRTAASLTDSQWKQVRAIFKNAQAKNAKAERQRIAKAIALIERQVVKNTGMVPDRGEAHTFEKDQDQMDCLDETINTSLYLGFFEEAGWLRYHYAAPPVHRGYFIDGLWPHNSGAVRETVSGDIFAIDSYYADNGAQVHVVALDIWLDEWRPDE